MYSMMSTVITTRRSSPATTPLYEGFATIRGRSLMRSLSIRAKELEAANDNNANNTETSVLEQTQLCPFVQRDVRHKNSIKKEQLVNEGNSGMSQSLIFSPSVLNKNTAFNSSTDAEDIYINRPLGKPVKAPTVGDVDASYVSINTSYRPPSDTSSSSGHMSNMAGCRDSALGSTGSGSISLDYQSLKKTSRFSLDSLHSSTAPKTPDYNTNEEDQIFLYTAPKSPKIRIDSGISCVRNSYEEFSDRDYSPLSKISFEMQEDPLFERHRQTSSSHSSLNNSRRLSSTASIGGQYTTTSPYKQPTTSSSPKTASKLDQSVSPYLFTSTLPSVNHNHTYNSSQRIMRSSLSSKSSAAMSTLASKPPPIPIRRESLATRPKISNVLQHSTSNYPSVLYDTAEGCEEKKEMYEQFSSTLLPLPQRSSSVDILEKPSFGSRQSLTTLDQDAELLAVPSAMPVLQNAIDRRYYTLGHTRVHSIGSCLHQPTDSPVGSMLNVMGGSCYDSWSTQSHSQSPPHRAYAFKANLSKNKSAGSIIGVPEDREETNYNGETPEYTDPLDFKIGCQTTLRSKPIIPWYELAIRKDIKRQSCPPITSSIHVSGTQTLSAACSSEQVNIHKLYIIF